MYNGLCVEYVAKHRKNRNMEKRNQLEEVWKYCQDNTLSACEEINCFNARLNLKLVLYCHCGKSIWVYELLGQYMNGLLVSQIITYKDAWSTYNKLIVIE